MHLPSKAVQRPLDLTRRVQTPRFTRLGPSEGWVGVGQQEGHGSCGANSEITQDDLISDEAIQSLDEDRLGHGPIAERVAEIILAAEQSPVNVALFGPWGSGKSSFAHLLEAKLKAKLERQDKSLQFVRYVTWRFQGESLQRNFLTHAAKKLGMDHAEYSEDLYSEIQTAKLNPDIVAAIRGLTVPLIEAVLGVVFAVELAVVLYGWWFGKNLLQTLVEFRRPLA